MSLHGTRRFGVVRWKMLWRNSKFENVVLRGVYHLAKKKYELAAESQVKHSPKNYGNFSQNVNGKKIILAQPTGKFPK